MFKSLAFAFSPSPSTPECFKCSAPITGDWWEYYEKPFCSEECVRETHFDEEGWFLEMYENPQTLRDAVRDVLAAWGLVGHLPKFFSPDGLVVVALLCNAAAKWIDPDFYGWKPHLVCFASKRHNSCWQDGDIVYFETCVGQISFHVFEGEGDLLPAANGRQWRGGWMQENCLAIAEAYLNGGDDDQIEYEFSAWLEGAQI